MVSKQVERIQSVTLYNMWAQVYGQTRNSRISIGFQFGQELNNKLVVSIKHQMRNDHVS